MIERLTPEQKKARHAIHYSMGPMRIAKCTRWYELNVVSIGCIDSEEFGGVYFQILCVYSARGLRIVQPTLGMDGVAE